MAFFNKNNFSSIGLISFIFLIYTTVAIASTIDSEPGSTVIGGSLIVWNGQRGAGYPVYLSEYNDGKWSKEVQVTDSDELNLVPSVTKDDAGVIWVVWTVFNGGDSELFFKRYIKGEWSEEQKIETGLAENNAPTVIIDNKQTLWLAWSASDGVGDDIFFARWNGSHFEAAERITDSTTPDVLPILGMAEDGIVWVQWQAFNDGAYTTSFSEWDGDEWTTPSTTKKRVKAQLEANDNKLEFFESSLPDVVNDHKQSSIHIPGFEIQSLPLKFFELMDEQENESEM